MSGTLRRIVAAGAAVLCVGVAACGPARAAAPGTTRGPADGSPPGTAGAAGTAGASPFAGKRMVAHDEFDGDVLDKTRWRAYDSTSSNGVSHFLPSQVSVGGGELRIVGQGRDATGAANKSGAACWCSGDGNQTYGIWALKAKLDYGKGYAPAMLLWPRSNRWPQDGETDILETVQPKRISDVASVHWGQPPRGDRESGKVWGDFTRWHVYWVDWQPDYIKIYVDRTLVYDSTTSKKNPVIPDNPMHLVLQQEPGPYAPKVWLPAPDESTPDRVVMHVAWVRIYR